jgi:hypothetical protein
MPKKAYLSSLREHLDQLLKWHPAYLLARSRIVANLRVPRLGVILRALIISPEPVVHPLVLACVKGRLKDGNHSKWDKEEESHHIAIECRVVPPAEVEIGEEPAGLRQKAKAERH